MSVPIGIWDSALLTSHDSREFPRLPVWGDAKFRVAENLDASSLPVTLIDISHGGVCFAVAKELQIGQRVVLDMESPGDGAKPLSMEAEVRWIVADTEPGEFRIGCSWSQRLNIDDLLKFC